MTDAVRLAVAAAREVAELTGNDLDRDAVADLVADVLFEDGMRREAARQSMRLELHARNAGDVEAAIVRALAAMPRFVVDPAVIVTFEAAA